MAPQSRSPADPPAILLTRPEPQGARCVAAIRAQFGPGIRIVASPLLAPVFLPPTLPDRPVSGVIFTSETAVLAAEGVMGSLRFLHERTAWCVGHRTAEAARAAGFDARSAGGDADDLLAFILAAGETGPLLHLRGEDSRGSLAERLTAAGTVTLECVVYAQMARPLTPEAVALLQDSAPVLVALFSPRSAALFADAAGTVCTAAPLWIAALSPAVAKGLAPLSPQRLCVAARPDSAAMLAALATLLAAASDA